MTTAAYKALEAQLNTLDTIEWIDVYNGQLDEKKKLEEYGFDMPAVFIAWSEIPWETLGKKYQEGDVTITLHLAYHSFIDTNALRNETAGSGLAFIDFKESIYQLLQGFIGYNGSTQVTAEFVRVGDDQDTNHDSIYVTRMQFKTRLFDNSAAKVYTPVTVTTLTTPVQNPIDRE